MARAGRVCFEMQDLLSDCGCKTNNLDSSRWIIVADAWWPTNKLISPHNPAIAAISAYVPQGCPAHHPWVGYLSSDASLGGGDVWTTSLPATVSSHERVLSILGTWRHLEPLVIYVCSVVDIQCKGLCCANQSLAILPILATLATPPRDFPISNISANQFLWPIWAELLGHAQPA